MYYTEWAKKSDTACTYITLYKRYHFFWPTRLAVRTDGRTSDRYITSTHGRCTIEIHDHAHKFGKDRTFGSRDMPSISDW